MSDRRPRLEIGSEVDTLGTASVTPHRKLPHSDRPDIFAGGRNPEATSSNGRLRMVAKKPTTDDLLGIDLVQLGRAVQELDH